MKPKPPILWLIIGDYNEILFQTKKGGGKPRSEHLMHEFRKAMEHCHLRDLRHRRFFFTWSNCYTDSSFMKERLDRALADAEWIGVQQFGGGKLGL